MVIIWLCITSRSQQRSMMMVSNLAMMVQWVRMVLACRWLPTYLMSLSFILALINRIWTSYQFPTSWLCAIVLVFQKPGQDPFVEQNYRHISLTSCICKVMQSTVNSRIVWILEARRFINSSQFGFRHGRSTVGSRYQGAFTLKEHTFVFFFFHLQKAYDATWRHV